MRSTEAFLSYVREDHIIAFRKHTFSENEQRRTNQSNSLIEHGSIDRGTPVCCNFAVKSDERSEYVVVHIDWHVIGPRFEVMRLQVCDHAVYQPPTEARVLFTCVHFLEVRVHAENDLRESVEENLDGSVLALRIAVTICEVPENDEPCTGYVKPCGVHLLWFENELNIICASHYDALNVLCRIVNPLEVVPENPWCLLIYSNRFVCFG